MKSNDSVLVDIEGLHIEGQSEDEWLPIISGVDLTLNRGEVLGLIGESGAGKSTLGLAAMGYARPGCRFGAGSIYFDGIDLRAQSDKALRKLRGVRIAYVAQSAAAAFNPAYKLIDQFSEIPVRHGISDKESAEADARYLYGRFLLPNPDGIGFRYPHQVSGGQLQRAMTAMALSCRPDLVIFDEPTTALDVTTQIEVLSTIRDIIRDFNTAAIYITHDLAVVAQMADRIMVLRHGELVEEAQTREMLADPKEAYTRSLWAVRTFRKQNTQQSTESAPLIRIENITARYGRRGEDVLKNVSIDVHRGETVAVVGESGSGKSTTARVITGLLRPRQGRIIIDGEVMPSDYRQRSRQQLRHAQMIYQMADTALNPKQRIREIIGRPLSFYLGLEGKALDERIRDLLSLIELEPNIYIDRRPSELSGGQKQRISIARALAAEPEFVICDEVTSALDQIVAEGILKLLVRLQQELQLSYLFITHDLATVQAIADHVVVMLEGRVVEQGDKQTVLRPPHHEYTEQLLSSVPEMDPDWLDRLLKTRQRQE